MSAVPVRAVVFDFDGTLTLPGAVDLSGVRRDIGCPLGVPLMGYIEGIAEWSERERAREILERCEIEGAYRSVESPDAAAVVRALRGMGVAIGIMTNNSRRAFGIALGRFTDLRMDRFDVILSREDAGMKPSPDPILHAAAALGCDPSEVIVVGDYLFDVRAGNAAGAVTVFLSNGEGPFSVRFPDEPPPDHEIGSLKELGAVVRLYLPLPEGKVPNDLLAGMIGDLCRTDPAVLIGPGVGRDAAVIRVPASDMVVTSDPITLAAENAGTYAVTVNANDVAAAGADPRWFLSTILVPPGTLPIAIRDLIRELDSACAAAGVSLCGGHTEVSGAVARPIVSGTMIGTRDHAGGGDLPELVEGDPLYLTKRVAVEGTAILAVEFDALLLEGGADRGMIERGAGYADLIGIVAEARAARRFGAVMHDVTEGGIATALREFADAVRRGATVDLDAVPVFEETARFCSILEIDPLGLIGSGSLLIGVPAANGLDLEAAVRAAGAEISRIGTIGSAGGAIVAVRGAVPAELPDFRRDELARLYEERR